jgi:TPR repeat protein
MEKKLSFIKKILFEPITNDKSISIIYNLFKYNIFSKHTKKSSVVLYHGFYYLIKKQYSEYFEYINCAVYRNNARAMNCLGNCYYKGLGTEVNYNEAFKWFLESSNQGNFIAMKNLGDCYYNGHGTAQDYDLAWNWYYESAELGNVDAINSIGECYFYGHGIRQDLMAAFDCYLKAANLGHAKAMFNIGNCHLNNYGTVHKDDERAYIWYIKAADIGHTESMNKIIDIYINDADDEFKWSSRSAQMGDPIGMYNLAKCYKNGYGVAQCAIKCAKLFEDSAKLGNVLAMECLADIYYNGNKSEQNFMEAIKWYKLSTDNGSITSAAKMNEMIKSGMNTLIELSLSLYQENIDHVKLIDHLKLFPGTDFNEAKEHFNLLAKRNFTF